LSPIKSAQCRCFSLHIHHVETVLLFFNVTALGLKVEVVFALPSKTSVCLRSLSCGFMEESAVIKKA